MLDKDASSDNIMFAMTNAKKSHQQAGVLVVASYRHQKIVQSYFFMSHLAT